MSTFSTAWSSTRRCATSTLLPTSPSWSMDLARLALAGSSATPRARSTAGRGGDPGDDALLSFYASYRAWVRSKVTCRPRGCRAPMRQSTRARLGHQATQRGLARARPSIRLASPVCRSWSSSVVLRPAGRAFSLSRGGSGAQSGLQHLNSDVDRKAPRRRLRRRKSASPEHYSEEFNRRTYEELGRLAVLEIERRGGAIVDATFHRLRDREAFATGLGRPPYPSSSPSAGAGGGRARSGPRRG